MTHFVSKTTLTTFSIMSFSKTFPEVFFQQSKLYVLNFGVFFSHAFQLHFRSWVLFSCQVCTLSCWQGRESGNGTLKGVICKRDIFFWWPIWVNGNGSIRRFQEKMCPFDSSRDGGVPIYYLFIFCQRGNMKFFWCKEFQNNFN